MHPDLASAKLIAHLQIQAPAEAFASLHPELSYRHDDEWERAEQQLHLTVAARALD